jgi:hypothetical protein
VTSAGAALVAAGLVWVAWETADSTVRVCAVFPALVTARLAWLAGREAWRG